MGVTAEGQDNGDPTNTYAGWPSAPNPDPNAKAVSTLDFAAQGGTGNIVGTSTGPHKAAFALGDVPD